MGVSEERASASQEARSTIPRIRDRIEMLRAGIARQGTVHYADELQVLVKWDDGRSSSLRMDRVRFKILEREDSLA